MTLVELLVGLAVGLFVSVVAISLFSSTRTLAKVGSSSMRMSENARLAMDLLHKDLRSAGFQGCSPRESGPPVSTLNVGNGAFLDPTGPGINGYQGTGAGFSPGLNAALSAMGVTPAPNSDIVSVRVPVEPISFGLSAAMATSSGDPQVGAATIPANTLVSGSIALIANCKAGAVFQVTEADPAATGSLGHIVGGGFVPGNSSADLQQVFRGDAAVYQMETHHYFVANPPVGSSHAGICCSLYRYVFPPPAGKSDPQVEEMAAGIERLVLSYGVGTTKDRLTLNRYANAAAVTAWDQVLAVRVQMLASTPDNGTAAGKKPYPFAGSSVTPTDNRLRSVLTEDVTLRSRVQ